MVGACVALAALGGAYFKGRSAGAESRNGEIVALQSSIERSRLAAIAAEEKANEAAAKVRVEYRTRTETIVKESEAATGLIEVVKRDHAKDHPDCTLPASLRLLWNRTGSGSDKAEPATGVNDAPVTVAELAEGVRQAQDAHEANAAKLIALQSYVAQIQDAKPVN